MFDEADLADVFQIPQVLANNARDPVPAPDAMFRLILREKRFRKPPEFQQGLEVGARRLVIQLAEGKRMEAEVPVAARERVAAFAVVIEPGGAGDDDFAPGSFRVVDAFEQISPPAVFVNLIQKEQRFPGREFRLPQPGRHAGMIPVEIGGVRFVRSLAEKAQGERRFANLARTADKHHLSPQTIRDGIFQITRGTHRMDYSLLYS
ncbi:MAG TPA: hypothetical protein VI730_10210 [Burkholderiales bacterium]|nr:hypothetical protein [Burkholderiales bacterium]